MFPEDKEPFVLILFSFYLIVFVHFHFGVKKNSIVIGDMPIRLSYFLIPMHSLCLAGLLGMQQDMTF